MKKKNDSLEVVTKVFLEIKLDEVKRDIDDKAKGYRDEILTKLDGVMGELQTIREENTVGAYQTRELREEVDSHKKRIRRLEKPHIAA